MSLASLLYNAARTARDTEVILSGNPLKITRRFINKRVMRKVGKWVNLKGKISTSL